MSCALRSSIFVSAISRTCCFVTDPTLSRLGTADPFSTPAAFLSRSPAGGVLVTKVNVRSSYTVISAGMMLPACAAVRSLYALVNSMMLMPCGPRAVPTGGAGVAFPAGICRRMTVLTFFLPIGVSSAQPLDLEQVELDRRLAAEHVHQHLELALLHIDIRDLAVDVGGGPVDHADVLPHLVFHRHLGLGFRLDLLLNAADLVLLQRHRLIARTGQTGTA